MEFTVNFQCDNAAFGEGSLDRNEECARILRHVADALENDEESGIVLDVNGNSIGTWKLREEASHEHTR